MMLPMMRAVDAVSEGETGAKASTEEESADSRAQLEKRRPPVEKR
jgi:hypothetical protein